jgi:PAS domain S-box-containing protein
MSSPPASSFDLSSLAQAVRAISSEFSLPDLQRTMLRVIQQSVGAAYAALVGMQEEGRGWIIHEQSEGEHRTIQELPASVLHGARRTLAPIILAGASTQPPYSEDEVVRARGLRSVLCWPLTHRGVQHGLLYLESAQLAQAFESTCQEVMDILAAQAAAALDNARLHQNLAEQSHAHEASRREVSATRQNLRDVIDHSPAAIYVKDLAGRFVLVNQCLCELMGLTHSQLVGKRDSDIHSAEVAAKVVENDRRVLATGASIEFEEHVPIHGELRIFLSSKFPLRGTEGNITAICGISTDITDRKRAESALQRLNEELEHRVAERTEQLQSAHRELLERARHAGMAEIATSILHNLGNALTSITVSSTVLRDRIKVLPVGSLGRVAALLERPPEELGRFITQDERGRQVPAYLNKLHTRLLQEQEALLQECTALSTTIDHANGVIATQQDYARSRISLSEKARLRELAEDALRLCALGGPHDKLIQREYAEEEPEFYERHMIVQILVNLISNARNAVRERLGNVQPFITISTRQDTRWTVVSVSDNGTGFDQGVKARLFTHGFTTRAKGHGFGLHSSALSAETLGGRIEAYSDGPGQGARFSLYLPRAQPEA